MFWGRLDLKGEGSPLRVVALLSIDPRDASVSNGHGEDRKLENPSLAGHRRNVGLSIPSLQKTEVMPRIPTIISQIDIDVGARIRARRKLLGMTQSTLAEALGITFQQVQKYEKGSNRVGSSRLQHIAQVLGTTPSALFGEEVGGSANFADAIMQSIGSADGVTLNKAFIAIKDDRVRKSIVNLVKAIADEEPSVD